MTEEKYFLAVIVSEKPIETVEEAFSSCEEGEPRAKLEVSYFKSGTASQVNAATFASSFIRYGGHKMAVAILMAEDEELSPWFRTEKDLRFLAEPMKVQTALGVCNFYEAHTKFGVHLARVAKMLCFAEGFVVRESVLPTFVTK